jgi:hypothetical protein
MFDYVCLDKLKFFKFGDYLHLIYPNQLEAKDTTDTQRSASYLDLHFETYNGGRLKHNSRINVMTSPFQ